MMQSRRRIAFVVVLVGVALAAEGVTRPAVADEGVRLLSLNRARVGSRDVTLAGVMTASACAPQAEQAVSARLGSRPARFVPLAGGPPDTGFVVLPDGVTLNQLALETGCPRFNGAGLPPDDAYVKALGQAWRQLVSARTDPGDAVETPHEGPLAPAAAATGAGPTILANWSGSGDMTTGLVRIPAGTWEVVWLVIPREDGPANLTIVVLDDRGRQLFEIPSGPVTGKRLDVWTGTAAVPFSASFKAVAVNALWGVWVQTK